MATPGGIPNFTYNGYPNAANVAKNSTKFEWPTSTFISAFFYKALRDPVDDNYCSETR